MSTKKNLHIIINGGGLVGALTAIYMLRHTPNVVVVEKRADLRTATAETGRSINLILTSRGLHALRKVQLEEKALALCVPVTGRMMHGTDLKLTRQPYGLKPNEVNFSVSRTALNAMLIDEAERRGARFYFKHTLQSMDFQTMCAVYECDGGKLQMKADFFLGTDGVGSATRVKMIEALNQAKQNAVESMERLGISYKELTFHATTSEDTKRRSYSMDHDFLHIWARGQHFLMALADKNETFTGTLYLPDGSRDLQIPTQANAMKVPTFVDLNNQRDAVEKYFQTFYPDVPALVPDYLDQLTRGAVDGGLLATLRTSHWYLDNKCCLLGDAAHGIVPFFGQGMNLGFESVVIFDTLLRSHKGGLESLHQVLPQYTEIHKPSATAIADMAIENFAEMSSKVAQPEFLARKSVERHLEANFSTKFRSRYYMVTKTLIPYALVQEAGRLLDQCIDAVLEDAQRRLKASGNATTNPDALAAAVEATPKAVLEKFIDQFVTPFLRKYEIEVGTPEKVYYSVEYYAKHELLTRTAVAASKL